MRLYYIKKLDFCLQYDILQSETSDKDGIMTDVKEKLWVKDDYEVQHNLYDLPKGFVFEGSINLSGMGLEVLPDLSDITVTGNFHASENKLTTLKGSPKKVGKNFFVGSNKLITLKGAPKEVGGCFQASYNQLTTLKGASKVVDGYFDVSHNKLITLKGAPKKVSGSFFADDNQLTSLEGVPEEVGWDFDIRRNQLTSLDGAPKVVGGKFFSDLGCFGGYKLKELRDSKKIREKIEKRKEAFHREALKNISKEKSVINPKRKGLRKAVASVRIWLNKQKNY